VNEKNKKLMKISKLCASLSYAAIYGSIHFPIAVGKLIAEEFGVVKSQSAAAGCSRLLFRKNYAKLWLPLLSQGQALDASHLYAFHTSAFTEGLILDNPDQSGNHQRPPGRYCPALGNRW